MNRNKAILQHYRAIAKLANRYAHNSSIDVDELINEGVLGFITAYERYKREAIRIELWPFAYQYVRGRMWNFANKDSHTVSYDMDFYASDATNINEEIDASRISKYINKHCTKAEIRGLRYYLAEGQEERNKIYNKWCGGISRAKSSLTSKVKSKFKDYGCENI